MTINEDTTAFALLIIIIITMMMMMIIIIIVITTKISNYKAQTLVRGDCSNSHAPVSPFD